MTVKKLRALTTWSQQRFGAYFNIPLRTIQNWEGGASKCNQYVIDLMAYKLLNERIITGMDMEKKFIVGNEEYVVIACTAIASCDNKSEESRQNALAVYNQSNSGEYFDYVVFGWDMPTTKDEFMSMCDDESAWESDDDVIDSVIINGKTYKEWIS